MTESDKRGWFGDWSQAAHYMRTVGADQGETGKFRVEGGVFAFLGLPLKRGTEVAISADAKYFVDGKPFGLADGLGTTSYGIRPIVIGGY